MKQIKLAVRRALALAIRIPVLIPLLVLSDLGDWADKHLFFGLPWLPDYPNE